MKLITFIIIFFLIFQNIVFASVKEYYCTSSKKNNFQFQNIRFQINEIIEKETKFSMASIRDMSSYTLKKWSDWSFIDLENNNRSRLVWYSYKKTNDNGNILVTPINRFRFDLSDSSLILERSYEPLGVLSAQLSKYSCVIIEEQF